MTVRACRCFGGQSWAGALGSCWWVSEGLWGPSCSCGLEPCSGGSWAGGGGGTVPGWEQDPRRCGGACARSSLASEQGRSARRGSSLPPLFWGMAAGGGLGKRPMAEEAPSALCFRGVFARVQDLHPGSASGQAQNRHDEPGQGELDTWACRRFPGGCGKPGGAAPPPAPRIPWRSRAMSIHPR